MDKLGSNNIACFACFSVEVKQCETCIRWYCQEHQQRHTPICDNFGKKKKERVYG